MASSKPGLVVQPEITGNCSICGAPRDPHYRPFCSRRCADVDLSRWLRGAYAIPSSTVDDNDDGDDAIYKPALPAGTPKDTDDEDA